MLYVVIGVEAIHSEQFDHMKILEKLIELGDDLSIKDVAGHNFNITVSTAVYYTLKPALRKRVKKGDIVPFGRTPPHPP